MSQTATRLLSVDEALERVLDGVVPLAETERIPPEAALGRVLAEDVVAATSLPPWDNSAMDGYAIRASDTRGATEGQPVRLEVVGELAAGAAPDRGVAPGAAIRIATGAAVPPEADAVVPVEETTPLDGRGLPGSRGRDMAGSIPAAVLVHIKVPVGMSIRAAGGDVTAGATIMHAGATMTPARVALASGSGVGAVLVRRRPVVAVLATGDELRRPGEPLGAAGIPDANGPGLRSLVRDTGGVAVDLGIALDELGDVRRRLETGIAEADAVIVSGGVSVGPYDVVKQAFDEVGDVDLWRVAVQPGKPFTFGRASRSDGAQVLLFGLPGNPVSSFVTFELFVRPVVLRLAGASVLARAADRAVLEDSASTSPGRRGYLRVASIRDDAGLPLRDSTGRVRVRLAGGQGSHMMSALATADALAVVPEEVTRVEPGDEVELRWLDRA